MNFSTALNLKVLACFLVLIVYLAVNPIPIQAQPQTYREIREFYNTLTSDNDQVSIPFLDGSDRVSETQKEILQIILVRHGTPVFDKKGWHTFYGAMELLRAYDTVAVYPLEYAPVDMESGEINNIYSSPLPRTRSTALQLADEKYDIVYDSLFIEFRNEIVPIPWIRFPYKYWSVASRILWMAGLHSDKVPSLPYEKDRARQGAEKLNIIAGKEKRVILVAHGFLNRYLIRYLKRLGWHHSYDGGYDYANVQVLSKIIDKDQ